MGQINLFKYIDKVKNKPFVFGEFDCPLFTAGCLDAMYNTNLYNEYKGKWSSKKTAWRYARKNGEIQDHLKRMGFKEINHNFMTTGDVIIMEQKLAHEKKWKSSAVCVGDKTAVMTTDGLIFVKNTELVNIREVLRC